MPGPRARVRGTDPVGVLPDRLRMRDRVGAACELAARWGALVPAHRPDAPVVHGDRPVPDPVLPYREPPLCAHG
ncbi:hypothetical protein ABZZ17_00555 [Streptomyces sp. NPDC006512]|uniref:hypothetical protein n=1 Tax=Streptomyces sp. NPDC006512 TaxID=3154307 RepID=UPI0033AAB2FB